MHPPPSPARANFTLMTECTPESSGCYSVYSVGITVAGRGKAVAGKGIAVAGRGKVVAGRGI